MTWILLIATLGVVGTIAVACRRAHLEAEAQLCGRLFAVEDSAPAGAPQGATLVVVSGEGGIQGDSTPSGEVAPAASGRHLRLVG